MRFTSAIVNFLALTTSIFIFSIHARTLYTLGVSKIEKRKPKPLRTGYRCDALDFPEDSGWGNNYRIEGLRKVVKQSCGIAKKRLQMTEKQKLDREMHSFWTQDDPYPMSFPQYEKFGFSKEAQVMPLPRPMQTEPGSDFVVFQPSDCKVLSVVQVSRDKVPGNYQSCRIVQWNKTLLDWLAYPGDYQEHN
ncbi:BgtA-21339 [Blumeria graminis f. sp. tritici]|uniref:BgtA-21339 n=3 Tax=Blumeria graminis TaxID=34373 RepID=A0A9X9LA05_BLUGR|nr:hypothetical protein BGT96224_A21339 [Blumeria graminis f. sp. tritici 96224]VCU40529.1 BgtA-21339 [Blumeria graminis f. sp. tritici]